MQLRFESFYEVKRNRNFHPNHLKQKVKKNQFFLLKGTVQRDLFGWKWYHLIDPS
jgi:hypothetical protein